MSEPQARSAGPRGRGSGRGGRGGYSSRGGRPRQAQANGDKADNSAGIEAEDEGELGQLKRQYKSKLNTIKEMFPDWTDEDIVFALQETDGDLEGTVERISEGNVSQWGEVKKKQKDRVRTKGKDSGTDFSDGVAHGRGGRGRGDGTRGGRGRATERGRGAARGRGGAGTAGAKKSAPSELTAEVPSTEAPSAWDAPKDTAAADLSAQPGRSDEDADTASWEMVTPAEAAPPPAADNQKAGTKPDGTRSWASMLRPSPKPKAAPVKTKTPPAAIPKALTTEVPELPAEPEASTDAGAPPPDGTAGDIPHTPKSPSVAPSEIAANLTPSKDELTETNLEQVADTSNPVGSETVASNAGTTEARNVSSGLPPAQPAQQSSNARPVLGGFATTAMKATSGTGRSSSFQRRVKEQSEAVVMPGNHAVDRTAVQFGSMGLGGSEDLDVDDDREEAETRAQPPQHSPVAPRAALPPAAQQAGEAPVTTRPAPGLPPVPQQAGQADSMAAQQQQASQHNYNYNQFNNAYGASSSQGESAAPTTKPYEPFGQQVQQATGHQYDGYAAQSQAGGQPGHLAQHQPGAYSSSASDYPTYYTSDSQRNAYGHYYGGYGHAGQSGPHEASIAQQRSTGAFGSSGAEQPSVSAVSQGQQNAQSRFGAAADAQASGPSTPNPPIGQQHSQHQSHQMGHGQAGGHGFPYGGHPYYNSPYYNQFMNQYGYGGQGGYGSGPYGGGGKYGQPHQGYGMSPQSSYNAHSASPAGDYGQQPQSVPGRESSAGLGSYGRAGSTQPSESQTHTSGAFGGMSDVFNRSQSSYTQNSQQSGTQQAGNEESRYGDSSKIPGGPSPAPGQVGGRPGSAANVQGGQGGLPGSQSQGQQGYGNYPSHMGQHGQQSQYSGGLGGLGNHQSGNQSHQNSQYGNYGGFGGNYYSNNRGGWGGGNYGH